jgi:hypothetical protein
VAVTTADRDAQRKLTQKSMGSVNLGGTMLSAQIPDDAFPSHKAAFGNHAVRIAPDGTAWVHRAASASATEALVDLFQPGGAHRETLALPRGARVIGFGERFVYVSVPNAGDETVRLHRAVWR